MKSNKRAELTEEQKEIIQKGIEKGTSLTDIANVLGVPYRTVYNYACKFKSVKKKHKFTESEDGLIRAAYGHMRADKIAESLGLSISVVYNRARALGVRKYVRPK